MTLDRKKILKKYITEVRTKTKVNTKRSVRQAFGTTPERRQQLNTLLGISEPVKAKVKKVSSRRKVLKDKLKKARERTRKIEKQLINN